MNFMHIKLLDKDTPMSNYKIVEDQSPTTLLKSQNRKKNSVTDPLSRINLQKRESKKSSSFMVDTFVQSESKSQIDVKQKNPEETENMADHLQQLLSGKPRDMTDGRQDQDKKLILYLLEQQGIKIKYNFPADQNMAKEHAKTKYYGITTDKKCPCCNQSQKQRLGSLMESPSSLAKSQKVRGLIAATFFFKFIFYLIILLGFRIIAIDYYNIRTSLDNGNYCQQDCESPSTFKYYSQVIWNNASLYHKLNQPTIISNVNYYSFLTIIILIIISKIYRGYVYKKNIELDEEMIDETDYSIFIAQIPIINIQDSQKYLPKQQITKLFTQRIAKWVNQINPQTIPSTYNKCNGQLTKIQFINKKIGDTDLSNVVQNISLCYDINSLQRIEILRSETIRKLEEKMNKSEISQEDIDFSNKIIHSLSQFEAKLRLSYMGGALESSNLTFFSSNFLGKAFVSLKYQHFRDFILYDYEKNKDAYKIKGQQLFINKASNPADVRWENLKIKRQIKQRKIIYGKIIMFCVLLVSFIFLAISEITVGLLEDFLESNSDNYVLIFAIKLIEFCFIPFFVSVVNSILSSISEKLVTWESHTNSTDHYKSHLSKVTAVQAINTIIGFFLPTLFSMYLHGSQGVGEWNKIMNQILFFICFDCLKSAFIEKVKQVIGYFMNKIGFGEAQQETAKSFQVTLNQKMEEENFNLVERYSYYINITLLVSFISYVAPICVPATVITFFIMYWIDKHTLFHKNSFSYELSYDFTRHAISIAQFSILLYGIGIIAFSKFQGKGYANIITPFSTLNIMGVMIALVFTGLSRGYYEFFDRLVFKFFIEKKKFNEKPYDELKLENTYENRNPVSKYKTKTL